MRRLEVAFVVAISAGCSGTADPPPPSHGYQLQTPRYTVAGGEEKYLCYAIQLAEPADFAITGFESFASEHVHHLELFQTLQPEPAGLAVCDGSIKTSWLPLFGGGKNAGGLTLPDGAGFKLPHDAQLVVQLHLLNATMTPADEKLIVNLDYAADPSAITPAGIFAFGSMNINLPAGATNVQLGSSCTLPKTMNVFAAQPHMHNLGTRLTFELGASAQEATMVYERSPWTFGSQPIDSWQQLLSQGQFARATCTFDNTTDHLVTYGESTANEMCYLVFFYTPFDRLGACLN